eukprot:1175982-Prorocentrum_minimum.AAC.3
MWSLNPRPIKALPCNSDLLLRLLFVHGLVGLGCYVLDSHRARLSVDRLTIDASFISHVTSI